MAPNPFDGAPRSWDAPALNGAEVTPADGSDLSFVSRALYVGGAGDLEVVMAGDHSSDGATLTIVGVPAGTLLPLAVSRVKATGTTATSIVALW